MTKQISKWPRKFISAFAKAVSNQTNEKTEQSTGRSAQIECAQRRHKFTPQNHGLSDQLVDFFTKRITQLADGFHIQQLDKCGNPGEACGLQDEIIGWAK